uniref:Uncharacterized protein n=1 Tax=Oryza sativa subsp. japonica TaxID=39947 RepID=Q6K436_ORYSJ|nr:hypothetical protein [Oryza sativa Japonica Group]
MEKKIDSGLTYGLAAAARPTTLCCCFGCRICAEKTNDKGGNYEDILHYYPLAKTPKSGGDRVSL